jgi:hypothetical protein
LVHLCEAELRCLIEDHDDYRSSFSRELDDFARAIEGEEAEVAPEPPPSLVGLRGEEAKAARDRIEALLVVEGRHFGQRFPRLYGAEILACARGVKRALMRVRFKTKTDERVPAAVAALDRIIVCLERTPAGSPTASENLSHAILLARQKIVAILEHRPSASTRVTLFGLTGENIRRARRPLEALVAEEADFEPQDAATYARGVISACREARVALEDEMQRGTPRNRERTPAVIDVLESVLASLRSAEAAFEGDRVDAAPPRMDMQLDGDADRRAEAECWGVVLGLGLDLLDALGQSSPAGWSQITPSSLAAALGELGVSQPRLDLSNITKALEHGEIRAAWVELHDVTTNLQAGDLSPLLPAAS